jgi:hypothetical protein
MPMYRLIQNVGHRAEKFPDFGVPDGGRAMRRIRFQGNHLAPGPLTFLVSFCKFAIQKARHLK